MLSGISATCFTASYLVALGLEIARLKLSSRVRSAVMLGFLGAGIFAHTYYLAHGLGTLQQLDAGGNGCRRQMCLMAQATGAELYIAWLDYMVVALSLPGGINPLKHLLHLCHHLVVITQITAELDSLPGFLL